MTETAVAEADGELLYGVAAIAAFLGVRRRQALYMVESGRLPTFRIGDSKTVCARRSTLRTWLTDQEAAARQPKAPT